MKTIFLMGFMGSGKSAVARSLAKQLRCPLIDLDSRIEERAGKRIVDMFVEEGEAAFRELETEILREAADEICVVSLGGGVPAQAANRKILQDATANGATVVYLHASSETLAERIRRQPGKRPLIDGDGELDLESTRKRVEELLEQREPFYRECANLVIETESRAIYDVAREIALAIE